MNVWFRGVLSVVLFSVLSAMGQGLTSPTMALYSTTNATQREVAWSTVPGIRYVLQESTNLASNDWTTVAGFPSKAEALAQQHLIELDSTRRFFRVQVLDEQPPVIEESNPADGDFGVGRFSSVNIELSDATGVDSNSISLTLGTNGTFTLASSELSYATNSLVLDLGGDTALGGYGTTQEVTLAVADTLGNSTNYLWSFELEQEIDAATNLFVFGSPTAQRAGQRLSGLSATVAARFNGPVRMSSSSQGWVIDTVTSNEVMISYSTNAPAFEIGQMLANLAPAHKSEIFYRRVDSISDNTASNVLTLGTTDVLIGEIMENGSFSLGDGAAVFLEFDTNGTLVSAVDVNATIPLPVIGEDFSGTSLWSSGALDLSLAEGRFTLTPKLKVSLETEGKVVERFEAKVSGDLNISCVPQLTVTGSYNDSISKELWSKDYWYWTAVGYVPVGVQWIGSVTANAEINVDATAQMSVGFRQVDTTWVSGSYERGRVPASKMERKGLSLDSVEKVPFTYTLDGNGSAVVSLVPQIDCRLYGAAGIYLNTNPRLELSGSASTVNQKVTYADFLIGAYADINVGLSLIGNLGADLPPLSFNYFTKEWNEHYEAAPPPLAIAVQPASQSATYGDNVKFSVQAEGGTGSYTYQWYQDGSPIPGATGNTLQLYQVTDGVDGQFFVKIKSGSESVESEHVFLNIVAEGGTGPLILFEGLVAYYPFDGDANDYSGNGHHGSKYGATEVPGVSGHAYSFDGSNDYIDFGVTRNLFNETQATFSFWLKLSSSKYNTSQLIFASYDGGTFENGQIVLAYNPFHNGYSNALNVQIGAGNNAGHHRSFDAQLQSEVWTHVVVVVDNTLTLIPDRTKVYINGIEIVEAKLTHVDGAGINNPIGNTSDPFRLGTGVGLAQGSYFAGEVDEFRLYNRVLSATEIQQLYQKR